jgi:hypothetical protein
MTTTLADPDNHISLVEAGTILGYTAAYVGMLVAAGVLRQANSEEGDGALLFGDEVVALRVSGFKRVGITQLMLMAKEREPNFPFKPGTVPTAELLACVPPELRPQSVKPSRVARIFQALGRIFGP